MFQTFLDKLVDFFVYHPGDSLIFTDGSFWIFFLVLLGLYQLTYKDYKVRNFILLVFSLFFYYKNSGFYFFLLILSTIVDYTIGGAIHRSKHQPTRTWLLVLSTCINLGLLAFYKYSYMITDFANYLFDTHFVAQDHFAVLANMVSGKNTFDVGKIILPVGISFYTFQTMSYTIDIYKRKLEPVKNIMDFAFFVSFLPQLVAGPIVRASDFTPQIYEDYKVTKEDYTKAIYLIVVGLIKKMIFSNYISTNLVDRIFEDPSKYTGLESLFGVYGYAVQIYCDFSGYTDMAIGVALLLGYRLPLNFNSPYKSDSITDFWRRWHISLSSWLRDYLYISMGGNRTISIFTYMSVPLTLLIMMMVEGWDWYSFLAFVLISSLWIAWIKTDKTWLTYVALNLIVVYLLLLAQLQDWYLMGMWVVIMVFWILILIKPDKKKSISTYMNLMLTMLIGGLWHGNQLTFVIWGALHGLALAVHKFWMEITNSNKDKKMHATVKFFMQFLTFHFVCFCWIFFRAKEITLNNAVMSGKQVALKVINQIGTNFQPQLFLQFIDFKEGYGGVVLMIVLAMITHWLPQSWKDKSRDAFGELPDPLKAVVIVLVVLIIYQFQTSGIQPFIYFQF